ncbi:MAG: hypothetical protein WC141_07605 [Arcobacteraceae bacterium]
MKNKKVPNEIETILKELKSLTKESLPLSSNIVDNIIVSNCKDEKYIENTLDRLLDLCFDEDILYLYRKLCRYYYDINPQATINYIDFYKEMYDPYFENFGKNGVIKNG